MSRLPVTVTVATAPSQRTSICSGESCLCSIRPHVWGPWLAHEDEGTKGKSQPPGKPLVAGSTTVTTTLRPVKASCPDARNVHELTIKNQGNTVFLTRLSLRTACRCADQACYSQPM